MKIILALLGLAATATNAVELTSDNWDVETAGHCKKMKPDWDKLMADFAGSATQLVADVDCTADGKSLCETVGVRGYPTIKWGDPSDLQDYQGGRSYDDLKKFADENLKPMCSPKNLDLCDDDKKAEIKKFQDMPLAELDAAIAVEEQKMEDAEAEFKAEVQKLQDKYSALSAEKDAKLEAVKNSGLGLMKAVKASGPAGNDEL